MSYIQKIFLQKRALFLAVSAAFFLYIPSINGAEFFRWFALIPFLFLITAQSGSLRSRLVYLWFTGFLFLLLQYSIFWGLLPLDWIGISHPFLGAIIIFFLWVFVSGVLATPFLLLVFARQRPMLLIFLWPAQELFRSVLYSVISLGGSSVIGDTFTYGFLGYTAHTSLFLLSLAPYIHLFGMTALFVAGNVLFFYAWQIHEKKKHFFIIAGVLVCAGGLFFVEKMPSLYPPSFVKEMHIIALQGDNPFLFGYTEEYFKNAAALYEKGIHEGIARYPETTVLVAPESSQLVRTLAETGNKTYATVAKELLSSSTPRVLVYGDYDYTRDVSLVKGISNNETESEQETHKRLLMPLGEYQPYVIEIFARFWGSKEWVDDLLSYRNMRMSSENTHVLKTSAGTFSTVSCSEVFAGSTYRKIKKENPDVVLHLQRLASFHGDTRTFYESLRVSKFRAAELQKPIVGAVDGSGYSYIIDASGNVVSMGNKDSLFVHGVIAISQ